MATDLMKKINGIPGKTINAEINHYVGEFKLWKGKTKDECILMRKDEEGIWVYGIHSWELDVKLKLAEKRLVAIGQNPVFFPIGTEDYETANKAYVGGTN